MQTRDEIITQIKQIIIAQKKVQLPTEPPDEPTLSVFHNLLKRFDEQLSAVSIQLLMNDFLAENISISAELYSLKESVETEAEMMGSSENKQATVYRSYTRRLLQLFDLITQLTG